MKWEVHPISKFESLSSSWSALNNATIQSLLFDLKFVIPTLKYFSNGQELIAVLQDEGRVRAIAIIEKQSFGQWQTFQPSQSPLGYWLCEQAYFNESVIMELCKALPGFVLSLGITQQDPAHYKRPKDSHKLKSLDYITTGKLAVPLNFDDYWADRSRNVKQNYNRAKNRLNKQDIEISMRVLTAADDVVEGVGVYGDIESASWKAESGTAISRDNKQGLYYKELMASFAPDQVEVWQYLYNEDVVATDLCIKNDTQIIILKTTFIDEWNKFSPAFSMHIDGIKHLIDANIKTIEFYGPAMDWHKKLTEDLRTMYHVTWYPYPFLLQLKSFISKLKNRLSKDKAQGGHVSDDQPAKDNSSD